MIRAALLSFALSMLTVLYDRVVSPPEPVHTTLVVLGGLAILGGAILAGVGYVRLVHAELGEIERRPRR